MNTPMLRISEVAERLNCSVAFAYELVSDGRLRHHRLGKKHGGIRISEHQLQEYLSRTERGGETEEPAARKKTPQPSLVPCP